MGASFNWSMTVQVVSYLGVFGEEHLIISVRTLITNLFFKEGTFLNS